MMPQAQLDGLTIIFAEPAHSCGDNHRMAGLRCLQRLASLRLGHLAAMLAISQVACIHGSEPGRTPARAAIRPAAALVAGQRVQPGPQPIQLAQLT